jgi:hypothetical protein
MALICRAVADQALAKASTLLDLVCDPIGAICLTVRPWWPLK